MVQKNLKYTGVRGLENAILFSIILFLFNLIFPKHDAFVLSLIHETIVFFTIYSLYKYLHLSFSKKLDTPLSLVLNIGILGALLFFVLSIANTTYTADSSGKISLNFFNSLIFILIIFLFIASIVYIFTSLSKLFFLRQKNDPGIYFNTMLVFFTLSFFSNILILADSELDYPFSAFYVVSIILICVNSIRVAWIAFLTKKQKYYLLGLSIVLTIVYALAYTLAFDSEVSNQLIKVFSPGLRTLFSLVMIYGSVYFGVIFFVTLFHLPTAEVFDRKAQEVTSMMDITKLITQVFDFKELADTITSMTTQACNSDSAWLVTKNKNGIELNSVNKIGYVDANEVSSRLLGSGNSSFDNIEVIEYGSLFNDKKYFEHHYHSVAVAPLTMHGNVNGYLFTARSKGNTFDTDDRKSLQAFAYYAAVALENAILIKKSIEKERIEKELDVARDIQRKILPLKVPSSSKLSISALFIPAFEVGGDYYDFFELNDGYLGFVVADVSGKGISAAFIMAEVKGIFESLSKLIQKPAELLEKVNEVLKGNLEKKNFVTAVYGIVDRETGKITLARAGHTPSILCKDGKISRLQPAGIGLGLDYTNNFTKSMKELEIQLNNNDIFVCYSDGIPEAKNSLGEDFGYERFERIISENSSKKLDEISNLVVQELSLFTKDHPQHDDITLVLFRWN